MTDFDVMENNTQPTAAAAAAANMATKKKELLSTAMKRTSEWFVLYFVLGFL